MSRIKNKIVLLLILIPVWIILYKYLQEISDFIVFRVLQMTPEKHMTEALRFFIYEVPKVLMLLVLIIFLVGIIRTYFSPEKTRKALEGKILVHRKCHGLDAGNCYSFLLLFGHSSFPGICGSWNPPGGHLLFSDCCPHD